MSGDPTMSLSSIMNISSQGMQAQSRRLAATANNIANMDTPGYNRQVTTLSQGPGGDGVTASVSGATDASAVNPVTELTDMIEAGLSFAANASVFETGADLWDVLGTIKR